MISDQKFTRKSQLMVVVGTAAPRNPDDYVGMIEKLKLFEMPDRNVWIAMFGSQCLDRNVWIAMFGLPCWIAMFGWAYWNCGGIGLPMIPKFGSGALP
jgi:hypothetical protein